VREYTIQRVVEKLAREEQDTLALMTVLQAIILIEELDMPIKRNQTIILTFLSQHRASLFKVIHIFVTHIRPYRI
jgi:hypothetical protein